MLNQKMRTIHDVSLFSSVTATSPKTNLSTSPPPTKNKKINKLKKIPLHNWYSTIAEESSSNFLGLALIFLTPVCDSLALLDYIQNHESVPDHRQTDSIIELSMLFQKYSCICVLCICTSIKISNQINNGTIKLLQF